MVNGLLSLHLLFIEQKLGNKHGRFTTNLRAIINEVTVSVKRPE